MVVDIFVGILLVVSGCINILAIGAFWVTPSLRTTANRFVINLLLANFISCLILSPYAFNANANSPTDNQMIASHARNSNNASNNYNDSILLLTTNVGIMDNKSDILEAVYCENQVPGEKCLEQLEQVDGAIKMGGNENQSPVNDGEYAMNDSLEGIETFLRLNKYQMWSLDLVVALSVLSVLLVVMDTFIAVTDPLRYHSRISDFKAWLLIAFCWIISVGFGIASALRSWNRETQTLLSNDLEKYVDSKVYNMMFLLTYFLLIIFTPFLLVILMYWRIYSEARESGQRMRQNGSSPLLQSALNLAATATVHHTHTSPQLTLIPSSPQTNKLLNKQQTSDNNNYCYQPANSQIDGLTMKIDKYDHHTINNNTNQQINFNFNNDASPFLGICGDYNETKTFLLSSPPHECLPLLTTIDEKSTTIQTTTSQQHQNILLTLTTAACDQQIKRNHSAKHLLIDLGRDVSKPKKELRQVRSTPNLQKLAISSSDQLCAHQEQTLELPSIQASPKALRYMTSLRHRLSNASSLFKYREEGRAARISILVVIMFLVTYFPYGILCMLRGQSVIKESNITILSTLTVLLANVCSPIIFAYRNKRVRRGVRRLLGIDRKTNERLEKLNSIKRSCSTRLKNYRENNRNKSINFGMKSSSSLKSKNIRRTQSFVSCKYLTPPDAAEISLDGAYTSDNGPTPQKMQEQHKAISSNCKEKKSILKLVCDSSRKFGCQLAGHCPMAGGQHHQMETNINNAPVEV